MTLTHADYQEIRKLVEDVVEEKIRLLPTKEEFFKRMDEVMGELKTIREEHTVVSGQISDVTDRVEKLEEIHPNAKHSTL